LLDGGGYNVKIKLFYKYCQILQKLLQVAKQILCSLWQKICDKLALKNFAKLQICACAKIATIGKNLCGLTTKQCKNFV
jgi:hypothetical protein